MVLNVNGEKHEVTVDPDVELLVVLRNYLDLTGTKYGCGEGACGACTVLIDGRVTRSCMVKASEIAGRRVTTIEGLAKDGQLHPVQQAFLDVESFQCGFCIPGMILASAA